ncbi:MAG: hypothetical protein CMJ91_06945 [Planctomycetes bacterium]|nr:hypothetical protein [Planctomycetota bacterium]
MKKQINVAAIVDKLPGADRPGTESKFTGPAPDEAKRLVASVLSGGREAILELAEMIRDANGTGEKNYKPGYLLHAIALRVGDKGRDKERLVFTEALASLLGGANPPPGAQEYLLRELQCAGGPEVVKTIGGLLEKPGIWEHAVNALVAIETGAGEQLRKALVRARGRRRLAILQALGSLRDAPSTATLASATEDKDENIRLAAIRGLARIATPACVQPVVKTAAKAKSWEKIQANKAALLLAENLAASGSTDKARETCNLLINANEEEDDAYVREAAERIISGL